MKNFRDFVLFIISILLVSSCGISKPNTTTIIQYKDSTVVNTVDSVVYIPKERIIDIVPIYDTLYLETTKAKAISYVDTTNHVLRGSIENKQGIEYKYIYKDKIVYRDSLVTKEIEVPVEVIKEVKTHFWYEKILWMISILSLLYIAFKVWMKIKT